MLTAVRTDLNVTADKTFSATFAVNTYTLTYTAGANGTIAGTSPQPVTFGANGAPITATPSTGYHFASWSDGYPTAARTDTNVAADLCAPPGSPVRGRHHVHALTYTAGANGTITGTSPQTAFRGTGLGQPATPRTRLRHFV